MLLINVTKGELQSIYHSTTHLLGLDIFHFFFFFFLAVARLAANRAAGHQKKTDCAHSDIGTHSPVMSGGER